MNWMTIKEVAKYLKLSEAMIYKLAQKGEMPAAKIGSAWRFSEEAIDRWLGDESKSTSPFPEPIAAILTDFVQAAKTKYKENLSTVIVFGSRARGDAEPDSDVDVVVVLKNIADYWKLKMEIEDIAYSVTFDKGRVIVLSPALISEEELLHDSTPLVINIRKEGIKAA